MAKIKQKINSCANLALVLVTILFLSQIAAHQASASEINSDSVIKLVNDARTLAGLGNLSQNRQLMEAAQKKAEDMIEKGYFAHTSPNGTSPWYWFDEVGYDYKYAGENLAINFKNAEDQQRAWMNSPLHRKNILSEKYKEIGVASIKGVINGNPSIITVQEFGTLASEAASVSPVKKASVPAVQDNEENKSVGNVVDTKPVILSLKSSEFKIPLPDSYYAGMIAAMITLISFSLIALADTIIIIRKRKNHHPLRLHV